MTHILKNILKAFLIVFFIYSLLLVFGALLMVLYEDYTLIDLLSPPLIAFAELITPFFESQSPVQPSLSNASQQASVQQALPLTIDTRWSLNTPALIIVNPDQSIRYYVPPRKLMAYGGNPGPAGYTWGKPAGGRFLPPGITIDPEEGVVQGTGGSLPEPGVYYFDVEVSDGSSTATATFAIRVEKCVRTTTMDTCPYLELQQPCMEKVNLPNAKAGKPYGATLWAAGGKPPYSWSLDSSFPSNLVQAGLFLDERGFVRGTIDSGLEGQTISFKVIVRDSTGQKAMCDPVYEIKVEP